MPGGASERKLRMKRVLLAFVALVAVVAIAYGYTVTRRERLYRLHVVQGDYASARGDHFSAVGQFSDAIALKPDSMLGYLKRGEAHRRRGELDAAAADLERASALDPTAPRALDLLGDVEAARGRHGQAAERYAASITLDDQSPRVFYKLGVSRHLEGDPARAADALTNAVRLDGRFAEAHYMLGVSLREMHRAREAEDALKRAVALAPALLVAREELADLAGELGRRGARIAELERLLALDRTPTRYVDLALAHAASGDPSRAVRLLGSGAERYPDHAGIYLALGRVWLDVSQAEGDEIALSKAVQALQHAVSIEPSADALTALGRARLASLDAPQAERTLRQATDSLPADPVAFLQLAEAAERSGHIQAARRALVDYRSLAAPDDPRHRTIAERIGDLSMRLSDPRGAVRWFTTALEGGRATPGLLARLAQAQLLAGETSAARATLTRILEKDPENALARDLERRLKSPIPNP
jgi:tetratricopeptide (TPR) repeat protein